MFDLTLEIDGQRTAVAVGAGAVRDLGWLLGAAGIEASALVVLVTDRTVGGLYGEPAGASLAGAGFGVERFEIEPGEDSKRLGVAERLYAFLAEVAAARDSVVVALGGGVVSDLAGFVAATWMRGVRFAICPTTVEGAIDASIGGKTAVNIAAAKNLVGAFHQPVMVAIDPTAWRTLDPRDVRAGLAESIKHALIRDASLLDWHEKRREEILALEEDALRELILRNVRIKGAIVEADARERSGERMLLNFGHTIGHAIEARTGYALRHGECVSLGMVAACRISVGMGLLDAGVARRVEGVLASFGLPVALEEKVTVAEVVDTIRRDKKVRGGRVRFVLLEDVARPVVRDDVSDDAMGEAVRSLMV